MANKNNVLALNKLKRKGFEIEEQINGFIQSQINKEGAARMAGVRSEYLAEKMQLLKEEVELLSLQYNFPTKNDVANLARLMIQIEEKIETLEEQLVKVTESLEGLHQKVDANLSNKGDRGEWTLNRLQPQIRGVILSKKPGKDSKVEKMERRFYFEQ